MKQLFAMLLAAVMLHSCSLSSETSIGPRKAFELGDGEHDAFKAVVKNNSAAAVEVCAKPLGSTETRLLTLQPGQRKTVRFAANTKAIFKNNNDQQAVIKLNVTGDTGLSMGGPNY